MTVNFDNFDVLASVAKPLAYIQAEKQAMKMIKWKKQSFLLDVIFMFKNKRASG